MNGHAPNPPPPHTEKLTAEDQKRFATWRYVSPQTLKVEMGIAKAMEDMEADFKVRVVWIERSA